MRGWQSILRRGLTVGLAIALSLSLIACGGTPQRTARPTGKDSASLVGKLSEVSPPSLIQELRQELDQYQPQVKILSPRADEVLQAQEVSVRLQVRDLPIFKNQEFGLGPHLHVFLDNQPYQAVYSTDEPLVLTDLTPGTHTLRVFASRPWHESFKNEGAYAQITFHIFAKTGEHQPLTNQPLLTYSRPQGSYGAEPIMLDFYLTNAPLHLVAQENPDDTIRDWRVKCTVNGESFLFDTWEPIYLKGLKSGKNWVQLELVDEKGVAIANAFNNTVRIVTYEPGGTDTLSKLTRGELAIAEVKGIVDPNYTPPEPEPEPEPEIIPEPSPEPSLEVTSEPEVTPAQEAIPSPSPTVVPVIPTPEVSPSEPAILEEPAIEKKNLPEPEPEAEPIPPSLEEPAAPEPIPVVPAPVNPVPAAPTPEKPTGARGFLDRLREKRPAIQQSPTPSPVPSLEEKAPSELPKPDDLQVEEPPTSAEPAKQTSPAGLEEQLPKSNEPAFEPVQPTRGPKPALRSYLERFRRPVTEPSRAVPLTEPMLSPIEQLPPASQSPEGKSGTPSDTPVPSKLPSSKPPERSEPAVSAPIVPPPPVSPSPEGVRPVPLPVVTPTPEVEQNPEESLEDRIKRAVEERRRARLGQSVPTS